MELGLVFSLVQLILCFCVCSLAVYTLFSMAIHTLKEKGFGPAWASGFHMGTVSKARDQKTVSWRGISWEKKEQMKSLQGNSHNHRVGKFSICLKHAQSSELKAYRNRAIEYWWGPVREDSRHWLLSPSAKVQRLADHVGSLISGFKKRKIKINAKWWILYIQFEDWSSHIHKINVGSSFISYFLFLSSINHPCFPSFQESICLHIPIISYLVSTSISPVAFRSISYLS